MDAEREEVEKELRKELQEAAAPVSVALDECHTLADLLATADEPQEVRTRLRAALRRVVDGIWCVFVHRGSVRRAAIQIWFHGGVHRDYLVQHEPAKGNAAAKRPARTAPPKSFADAGAPDVDLRLAADVKLVERLLNDDEVMAVIFAAAEKQEKPRAVRRTK
jgi:hypothetical protein